MTRPATTAAVTGASGYLGSRIASTLESRGWDVARLVRSPTLQQGRACRYDLSAPISGDVVAALETTDVLVHAAYDLTLTRPADIWRVNVEGTRRLLERASGAQVRRIIVISSMSAFEGTAQAYGRAKLDIESLTVDAGGFAVRPGLVLGEPPGGMAAALSKLTRLPVTPVIAHGARQYTVAESELMEVIANLAVAETLPAGVAAVAGREPITFAELLRSLAACRGRRARLVPVPWQLVYGLLRGAEALGIRMSFRADSVLGLVHTAPDLSATVSELGLSTRGPTGTERSPS